MRERVPRASQTLQSGLNRIKFVNNASFSAGLRKHNCRCFCLVVGQLRPSTRLGSSPSLRRTWFTWSAPKFTDLFFGRRRVLFVTGCTDGIGKSYAKQLAGKGLNIVLMSRSKEKLETVASEIEKEYQVKTKIIQIDFSGGHEIYDGIAKELEGLDIGVLVNNVGVLLDYPEYFADTTVEIVSRMVNVNVLAMTMMTRIIIPAMCERKKGVVINIASFSAHIPFPLLSEYSASKIYMDKFSSNLHYEYADKGIIVQSVLPHFVATNLSGFKKISLFVPSPDDYVRAVLQKVGVSRMCYGYWPHELKAFIYVCLPEWAASKMILKFMENLRALRKRKDKSS